MSQDITTQAQEDTTQAQAMTTQENREVVPSPHKQVTTMAFHLRDFTRMNPPTFYGCKVDEETQELIDEVSKIHLYMGFYTSEKFELSTYQLKDVARAWYVQWRDNRPLRGGTVTWEIFEATFLDQLFPREMREEKSGGVHQPSSRRKECP